ncbi:MAG: gfo/Idh/MocA family oxidoreductase, partial [Bryobacteraceae bacterium]
MTQSDRRQFLSGAAGAGLAARAMAQASASQKKLRVGLIGAGGRGTYLGKTIQQFTEQGEPVELVSVCDIYQPRLERAEVAFKVK